MKNTTLGTRRKFEIKNISPLIEPKAQSKIGYWNKAKDIMRQAVSEIYKE